MQKRAKFSSLFSGRGLREGFLIAVFCLGACCGFLQFRQAKDVYCAWMRSAFGGSVSIVSLGLAWFLPLSITAIAVMYSKPLLIYLLCFGKAFLYSIAVSCCYSVFADAGWLAQALFLGADHLVLVVLLAVWLRALSVTRPVGRAASCVAVLVAAVAVYAQVVWLAPFAAGLEIF